MRICVFCGSRAGSSAAQARAARQVGRTVAERGHTLVYGGAGSGLMGEVAWAASHAGARIEGVMPRFLFGREAPGEAPPQDFTVTDTMHDRKREMLERSDAFVALAGGYGTLDEVLEVMSLTHLGRMNKPLVLVDVDGAWRQFARLVRDVRDRGFTDGQERDLFSIADDAPAAVETAEREWARRSRPRGDRV
ncbi:TIGR00730 family Rossman fold protein [Streptomyces sp. PKU-EA00015]|uniref:LOG family protein n=1 Tax=Streptomyces sp. PKU-EA00015 TaxID=2748326 RepID=UPI0015A37F72|nr:TIGR00730 family Rossman fold protein [Streptomyces sp. PKU-EA00015]NWF25738.1 TIGR00730 family Rossman fold protein [Streptomyces sp. PKU-EA00015]